MGITLADEQYLLSVKASIVRLANVCVMVI